MNVRPVVIALDGSRTSWTALEWAVDEARRTSRPLHVVGVCDVTQDGTVDGIVDVQRLLDDAAATVQTIAPALPVQTDALLGEATDELVDISRTSALLVLGRCRPGPGFLLHRSVMHRVLTHSHCPTVLVSGVPAVDATTVVVGVSESDGGRAALRFAFAEARLRDAALVAVRSSRPNGWGLAGAVAAQTPSLALLDSRDRTLTADLLRPFADLCPAVKIETVVSYMPLETLLEQAGQNAAMVVLGCRREDGGHLGRLGPVASWIAERVDFPVAVVGRDASAAVPVLIGADPGTVPA